MSESKTHSGDPMSWLHILISQLPPKNRNFHPTGQSRSVTNGGVELERNPENGERGGSSRQNESPSLDHELKGVR